MRPLIHGLHPFVIVLPIAVAVGMAAPLLAAVRAGHAARRLLGLLVFMTLAALVGAKAYALVEQGGLREWSWAAVTSHLVAGYRYPGGALALLLAAPLVARLRPPGLGLAGVADLMAPGVGLSMAVMRIHCVLVGCCMGSVCALPWCLEFPERSIPWLGQRDIGLIGVAATHSLPVHPLAVYLMLASLGSALVAWWMLPRKVYDGQVILWFAALHEGSKFLLEYWREPYSFFVQSGSLVTALLAVAALAVHRMRSVRDARLVTPLRRHVEFG